MKHNRVKQYATAADKYMELYGLSDIAFRDGALWADTHPDWISVDEEKPIDMDNIPILVISVPEGQPFKYNIATYDAQYDVFVSDDNRELENVRYWMYLLSPTKNE